MSKLIISRRLQAERHIAALSLASIRYGAARKTAHETYYRLADMTLNQADQANAIGLFEDASTLYVIAAAAYRAVA